MSGVVSSSLFRGSVSASVNIQLTKLVECMVEGIVGVEYVEIKDGSVGEGASSQLALSPRMLRLRKYTGKWSSSTYSEKWCPSPTTVGQEPPRKDPQIEIHQDHALRVNRSIGNGRIS
ncbi:hypothetical protein Tco_0772630 [Tanacetum coccineum]|uniref:Uncharacterized protein n=1 Tax=Tanacetum coccineum TaxID=301880 RepID=A0ABQ4ZIF6_9ASTR